MRDVDMSPQAITRRLELVSALSAQRRRARPRVDMSPEAITRRLRTAGELCALCHKLGAIGRAAGLATGESDACSDEDGNRVLVPDGE